MLNIWIKAFIGFLFILSQLSPAVCSSYSLGTQVVFSKINFKRTYGDNNSPIKFAPGINLFGRYNINNNFDVEVGYEIYKNQNKIVTIFQGQYINGMLVSNPINSLTLNSTLKQQNLYIGALIKTNILDRFWFKLLLGGAKFRFDERCDVTALNGGTLPPLVSGTYRKNRLIPIVKINLEHYIKNNFNLSLFAAWKNTSLFKVKSANPGASAEIRLKDTIGCGIGLVYYI